MEANQKATRRMWKATAMPRKRTRVPLKRTFTKMEFGRLTKGFVPQSMDNRWFIFFEKGGLYFHRSWTGRCIFQVRFKIQKVGYQIIEAWARRNPHQDSGANLNHEAALISTLIDNQLLDRKS